MVQDLRRLSDLNFLALDTETIGLFPIMHRLVEVGAVRFDCIAGSWTPSRH
jgi:DNA polymerase III epsilon subunit-like protein